MCGRRSLNLNYDREHLSTTAIEKDVIYLDIWGKGVCPSIRRWWHDLFLLSYSDCRSKHYYMSSYSMTMARTAQFRHNRSCIHPFSKFRNTWDCLILHLLLIRMTVFHFNTSIIHSPHIFCHYLVAAIEYTFILDLCVNAKTGYAIKRSRQIIMKSNDIINHYLSTNAFIHAMSAIPLQSLMFLRLGKEIDNSAAKANLFVPTLNIISLIHVVRLFQASLYWAKDRGSFRRTVTFKFVRIVVVGLVVIIQILTLHSSLSLIYLVMYGRVENQSYNGMLLEKKYQAPPGESHDESFFLFLKISRICKCFFLLGYTVVPSSEWCDRVTAILTHSVALMFHFWGLVVLYNCVERVASLEHRVSVHRSQSLSVLRTRRLPDSIHDKVVKYFDYQMSSLVIVEKRNCLYKALPRMLVSEIKMACYRKYVARIPCFANWPAEVISNIVELLEPEIYLADDIVSSARSPQYGLMLVEVGFLAVYAEDQEIGHLVDGDHLGELALVTDQGLPELTVIAIMPSVVLSLLEPCSTARRHGRQWPPSVITEAAPGSKLTSATYKRLHS